jgi:hypothetical protein
MKSQVDYVFINRQNSEFCRSDLHADYRIQSLRDCENVNITELTSKSDMIPSSEFSTNACTYELPTPERPIGIWRPANVSENLDKKDSYVMKVNPEAYYASNKAIDNGYDKLVQSSTCTVNRKTARTIVRHPLTKAAIVLHPNCWLSARQNGMYLCQ